MSAWPRTAGHGGQTKRHSSAPCCRQGTSRRMLRRQCNSMLTVFILCSFAAIAAARSVPITKVLTVGVQLEEQAGANSPSQVAQGCPTPHPSGTGYSVAKQPQCTNTKLLTS